MIVTWEKRWEKNPAQAKDDSGQWMRGWNRQKQVIGRQQADMRWTRCKAFLSHCGCKQWQCHFRVQDKRNTEIIDDWVLTAASGRLVDEGGDDWLPMGFRGQWQQKHQWQQAKACCSIRWVNWQWWDNQWQAVRVLQLILSKLSWLEIFLSEFLRSLVAGKSQGWDPIDWLLERWVAWSAVAFYHLSSAEGKGSHQQGHQWLPSRIQMWRIPWMEIHDISLRFLCSWDPIMMVMRMIDGKFFTRALSQKIGPQAQRGGI